MRREPEGDDALMMRFRGGDAAAFEILYDRYEAPLFGLCLRLLGNRAEAEDALQDAFAKVVDRRGSFDRRAVFAAGFLRSYASPAWIAFVARRPNSGFLIGSTHRSG